MNGPDEGITLTAAERHMALRAVRLALVAVELLTWHEQQQLRALHERLAGR